MMPNVLKGYGVDSFQVGRTGRLKKSGNARGLVPWRRDEILVLGTTHHRL